MLIAALFAIVKTWKQSNCPLSEEWIKKMWYINIYVYIYIYEYYSDIKKRNNFLLSLSNVICHLLLLSFATTWMDLETVILSEVNQREKEKDHMVSLICGI